MNWSWWARVGKFCEKIGIKHFLLTGLWCDSTAAGWWSSSSLKTSHWRSHLVYLDTSDRHCVCIVWLNSYSDLTCDWVAPNASAMAMSSRFDDSNNFDLAKLATTSVTASPPSVCQWGRSSGSMIDAKQFPILWSVAWQQMNGISHRDPIEQQQKQIRTIVAGWW